MKEGICKSTVKEILVGLQIWLGLNYPNCIGVRDDVGKFEFCTYDVKFKVGEEVRCVIEVKDKGLEVYFGVWSESSLIVENKGTLWDECSGLLVVSTKRDEFWETCNLSLVSILCVARKGKQFWTGETSNDDEDWVLDWGISRFLTKGNTYSLKRTWIDMYTFFEVGSKHQEPLNCVSYPRNMYGKKQRSSLFWLLGIRKG